MVCLVLSVAVIPAGAAETKLTSVYASYAAEGHTNAPVADDVFEAKSDSITVSILTTTDMHGRAYDWDSYKNSALSNNFLQAAKLVAERRAAVDDSILIDVGDILQGSALSSYNILQEGGENSPMATALRYIGYDAFVLGNHEFNYAPQIQWNYYNLLTSTDKAVAGQPVDVICSNVVETETNESVFSPYKTFTYKFEDGTTFTIGLLGFENMNNANWDVASHYEGCTFGHPDNTEKSYVYEWENYYGKEMQEKCDYIIVAMHSGEGNPDIYNQENQGGYFATHTTGVDMLLTGHNHQRNAVTLQNKNGENVLVMNGGGSTLGETVLTLTKGADGKVTVTAAESTMHPLNSALGKDENGRDIRVPSPDFKSGDPNYDGLKDLITPLFERSDAFVNKKIGTVSGTWDTISNYYLTQSDSYDLVHKAQIWAACTDNNIDPTKEPRHLHDDAGRKARLERQLPAGRRRNLRRHQPARLLLPVSVRQQHALHDPDDRRPAQELDAAHGTELPCQRRRSAWRRRFRLRHVLRRELRRLCRQSRQPARAEHHLRGRHGREG